MAYALIETEKIGTEVIITKELTNCVGYVKKGSTVKIIGIDVVHGYTIQDRKGNVFRDVGWIL